MAARAMIESHHIGSKAQGYKIGEIGGIHSHLDEVIQKIIVLRQDGQYLSTIGAALLLFFIIMPVTAVVTAESLVCTTILYLVSTFKTYRGGSFVLLILHTLSFIYVRKDGHAFRAGQEPEADFSFF